MALHPPKLSPPAPKTGHVSAHDLAGILLPMLSEMRSVISTTIRAEMSHGLAEQASQALVSSLREAMTAEISRLVSPDVIAEGVSRALAGAQGSTLAQEVAREVRHALPALPATGQLAPAATEDFATAFPAADAGALAAGISASLAATMQHAMDEGFARLRGLLPAPEPSPEAPEEVATANDYMDLIQLELVELLDRIHATKSEVASLRPTSGATDQLTAATIELEAVVQATEQATADILDAAEDLQATVDRLRSPDLQLSDVGAIAEHLEDAATNILMTCSFQDITGQRINASVNTLLYVEESLTRIVELWGITQGTADASQMRNAPDDNRPDRDLLHGPQLDGAGVSQDDIDRMFG